MLDAVTCRTWTQPGHESAGSAEGLKLSERRFWAASWRYTPLSDHCGFAGAFMTCLLWNYRGMWIIRAASSRPLWCSRAATLYDPNPPERLWNSSSDLHAHSSAVETLTFPFFSALKCVQFNEPKQVWFVWPLLKQTKMKRTFVKTKTNMKKTKIIFMSEFPS